MASLVLGPVLRFVDETRATVWVETDARCVVEILGRTAQTFEAAGHHYALVVLEDLAPGSRTPYEVRLDGERRWPEPDSPFGPSLIRTPSPERPARLAFGSCRVAVPHDPPWAGSKTVDAGGREVDALRALALRMRDRPVDEWPDHLLLLGDQVYADEVSPRVRELILARRDTTVPPGDQVADFEEYTQLYLEAWSEPAMRWLLSTIATAMIFDDHDVHDDWNISGAWVEDMRAQPWWHERIVGAFSSYWIYQHLGNLAPHELRADEHVRRICGAGGDAMEHLRAFAERADRDTGTARWSYARDLGGIRVVAVDSRAGRAFADGRRSMVDDDEWAWVCERLTGDVDHLVVATTLPWLLAPGLHHLEAWSEAVCDGAWGARAARIGERIRRAVDLEHWAAFGESFGRLTRRLQEVAAGEHGAPPASILVLSGDVHHAYLAEVAFRRDAGVCSPVFQVVCSPIRNPLDVHERSIIRFAASRTGHVLGRALARAAGVPDPDVRWRFAAPAVFDNQIATLELHGRAATLRIERTSTTEWRRPRLHESLERRLA